MKSCLFIFLLFTHTALSQTNPTQGPIASSNLQLLQIPCNNWLSLPSYQSYVNVGDLDVPGNTITVEAIFNRTAPYSNGYNWAGDLVSKHNDPVDVNYLLRPNNAEITTTNGYFTTPQICEIELNKVYHAAMVYDGSSLKFYRNGYLMSSVPATGNMFQNNHQTRIGLYDALTHNTNLIGYINEVRIWNVARTQAQINSFMNTSLPSPTTQSGLLAYYSFDNLLNKQGNAAWNGTLGGSATINATNPSCTFTADSCALPPCTQNNDFSFSQNICSPFQFTFATTSTGYESITWDFGDGNLATGSSTVSHTYAAQGNYKVLMIQKYLNCVDTVQKTFNINIQNDNQTILTSDTTICLGTTKQLRSAPASTYCWSPATYLDNASVQNPISSSPVNITYYLTSEKKGTNLIVNGDFSAGNTGFSSQYAYRTSNTTDGEYFVGTNPSNWYFAHFPCTDHTTGNGNMLLVNGSATPNLDVWKTTITVTPNTNYVFSTWISSISNPNPAQLAFAINGSTIGNLITASVPPCNWKQFYTTWNSGNATSAVISIVNKNLIFTGNDFALDDISFTPVTITRDSVKLTVENCATINCTQKNDFSFTQNVCVPYQFTFATTSTGYESITWNFGDGNSATGSSTVSHSYSQSGNYQVMMIQKYQSCIDTVRKTFNVNIQNDNQTILTPDTTICFGATKQLRAAAALTYCWSPATHLDNPSIQNPVSSTPGNITYYLTSEKKGSNLVINGNFSAGNNGFSSDYLYSPSSGFNPGVYAVGSSTTAWHPNMPACPDHTTGSGNMLLVNGAEIANVKVWSQTITVQPNTNYAFSTWLQHLTTTNPAILQFSINGVIIGPVFQASDTSCLWKQFYTTWASGTNTSATISIVNQNTIYTGNDFALDDISFTPVIITRDSIKISVDTPKVNTTADTSVCIGSSLQFNTSGASTFIWSPGNGLSSTAIANPVVSTVTTTKYIVTGTTNFGCTAKDSVTVTVNPKPSVTISNDTLICSSNSLQLIAGGGSTYTWSPSATLNNASVSNPVATPVSNTTYRVIVTDANSCTNTDSVLVNVKQPNTFTISPPSSVCINDTIQLFAAGGDKYNWTPVVSLNNPTVANPMAFPATSTTYDVLITDTVCNTSSTLTTTISVNPPPVLAVSKSNDVDCSNATSQLNVTGALQFLWYPSTTLNNAAVSNPIASPITTTQYFVTGKDVNGCSTIDSITVIATANNSGNYLMPNAFTPNNDGLNDCFGIQNWGLVTDFEFSIYNRWGKLLFYTKDPNNCWNGNFKAEAQSAGLYAYMINAKNACGVIKRNGLVTLIR